MNSYSQAGHYPICIRWGEGAHCTGHFVYRMSDTSENITFPLEEGGKKVNHAGLDKAFPLYTTCVAMTNGSIIVKRFDAHMGICNVEILHQN